MSVDFEQKVENVYTAILRDGDIAIDVGAHIGRHTIPIARALHPKGTVYAIEPLPNCREALSNAITYQNPELAGNVRILECALGARESHSEFVVADDAPWYSGLQRRVYDVPTESHTIPIIVRTLDGLFSDLAALAYIKVDAEGGEYHIFQGGTGIISKFRPVVTFEFGANSIAEYGITTRNMADFWSGLGYRLYDINGRALETEEMFVESSELQSVWDYVALPAENSKLIALVEKSFRT